MLRLLTESHPSLSVELLPVQTTADRMQDAHLAEMGGKGLFIKELEECLLRGDADLAVHSMKDVTMEPTPGLHVPVMLAREDCRDVVVLRGDMAVAQSGWDALPPNSRVGTSSPRRVSQLKACRPDVVAQDIRGNVGTRLAKLDAGEYDALLLAAAGLRRLGLEQRIDMMLSPKECLPAAGQGVIGVQCRTDDETQELLMPLHDADTADCVTAERAFCQRLFGGCQLPIAAYARLREDNALELDGLVARPDGSETLRGQNLGTRDQAQHIGQALAEELLSAGAEDILRQVMAKE